MQIGHCNPGQHDQRTYNGQLKRMFIDAKNKKGDTKPY